MTNRFKNTYIRTAHLTPEEINKLAKKYSEASGYPLEGGDLSNRGTKLCWNYLTSVKHRDDYEQDPLDVITLTDSIYDLIRPVDDLTEITEQNLDNHLQGEIMNTTTTYPDFDFKIDLSGMTDSEKQSAKEWMLKVAESRNISYIDALEDNAYFFWVEHNGISKEYNDRDFFEEEETPALTLSFNTSVTSWSCEKDENTNKELLQLEEKIDKLDKVLQELKEELKSILEEK